MAILRRRPWSVLISEGGDGESRAAVAATRLLSTSGYGVTVTTSGSLSLAAYSRFCDRRVRVPRVYDDPGGYAEAVRSELAAGAYLTVLPATDDAVAALALPGWEFLNKATVAARVEAAGLAVPETRLAHDIDEARAASASLGWPVVVKPDLKRGLARRLESADEVAALPASLFPVLVQPFFTGTLNGVLGLMWDGALVRATHLRYLRVYPSPCGTIAAAVTREPDLQIEAGLQRLLATYQGVFHVDLAGNRLLDVNPRIHASLPAAVRAGSDPLSAYCALLEGEAVAESRARPGVFFRWLEGDLRSVYTSVARGDMRWPAAARALAPRRRTVHSFSSILDPGPSLARLGFARRRAVRRVSPVR